MEKREIAESVERQPYFKTVATLPVLDDGTREMGELHPFLISGGENTERYYFIHINDKTKYKFNIRPKYFSGESNYTEVFPKRIKEILNVNNDAKIFCVFDWDTIHNNEKILKKHEEFVRQFQIEIKNGTVTICHSMPSIEYWFLLHFADDTTLYRNSGKVMSVLSPHMRPYFSDSTKQLKKLLKKEEYLKESTWVENLCADGKLALAIERAEKNIEAANAGKELDKQSFSYVYKVFKEHPNME